MSVPEDLETLSLIEDSDSSCGVPQVLVLRTLSAFGTRLCAQTIAINVIDGRNGHTMANACVNVWPGSELNDAMAIPTDKNGVARLRLTHNDAEINTHNRWKDCGEFGVIDPVVKYQDFVEINVGYAVCEPHGTDFSWLEIKKIPTKRLLKDGVVTANTCGKPNASPIPGELIIFVRPLRFWEKLRQ